MKRIIEKAAINATSRPVKDTAVLDRRWHFDKNQSKISVHCNKRGENEYLKCRKCPDKMDTRHFVK